MRFVFFDNDTRLLFATAYDGDWDAYIDDFVAKIPDYLDIIDSAWDGWPGIRSPGAKDYLAKHQITAEGWYVAYPDLTVAEIHRLKRIGKAVDEFLDKIGLTDRTRDPTTRRDADMATQTRQQRPDQDQAAVEQKIQKVRELYADAPEVGRVALKNGLASSSTSWRPRQDARAPDASAPARAKSRSSPAIIPLRARRSESGFRGLLELLEGNFQGADAVGTLHDMRFVFLDNDTKLLFATAYDGEWDAYIDDFATKIPNAMDILFCNCEGWPGNPQPR